MANFKTHYRVGIISSIIPFSLLFYIGMISFAQTIVCFLLSLFGSLLPDVDIPTSKISKFLYLVISIFISSFFIYQFLGLLKDIEIFTIAFALFAITNFSLPRIFAKFTRHRGVIHSIPMTIFLALFTTILCNYYLSLNLHISIFSGISIGYGFLIHLILDELYSVNILGVRLKKSFGTAMTLYEDKDAVYYFLLYLSILIELYFFDKLIA